MGNKWDCLLFDLKGSAITVKRASDRATREGYVCVVVWLFLMNLLLLCRV